MAQLSQSTLFSLAPCNERARDVVDDPSNRHLRSTLANHTPTLSIGFHIRSKSREILATSGRADSDIQMNISSISKHQCRFEINPETKVIMLCDMSLQRNTQVFGDNAFPFEANRVRKVVVQSGINEIIGMGGERCDLIRFKLIWHQDPEKTACKIKAMDSFVVPMAEDPRFAQTIMDEADTTSISKRDTRFHTRQRHNLRVRYLKVGSSLGSGRFGTVYKALNIDTGALVAVKIIDRPKELERQEIWLKPLKREIEILSSLSHPSIIQFIAWQKSLSGSFEIFMDFGGISLSNLIKAQLVLDPRTIADVLFRQIIEGIDYLAWRGIVHRDIKPDNILCLLHNGADYSFRLADFGLSNVAVSAETNVGTPLYQAPEFSRKGKQTSKADVWSFFVTMMWTLNVNRFRDKAYDFKRVQDVWKVVEQEVPEPVLLSSIREMGNFDEEQRASAARMLVKCYNGLGLSTPSAMIPALHTVPPKSGSSPTQKIALAIKAKQQAPSMTTAESEVPAPSTANTLHLRRSERIRKQNSSQTMISDFWKRRTSTAPEHH